MSDSEEKVVIEQTLVKIDEVFIYRIPPMRSADGHRAEDWNLAKPLATCNLQVIRRDNSLCINIMADRPKPGAPAGATETYLFAQSNITVDFSTKSYRMDHWVMSAIDTSRYFAIRISDAKTGREAFIGVGFRERSDAVNFKMSLQDYEESLKREEKAAVLQKQYEQLQTITTTSGGGGGREGDKGEDANLSKLQAHMDSKLSLKEGEKIHINIKGNKVSCSNRVNKRSISGSGSFKILPPPPGGAVPATNDNGNVSTEKSVSVAEASPESGEKGSTSDDVDWGDFEG